MAALSSVAMEYQIDEVLQANGQPPSMSLITALGCWQQIPVGVLIFHCLVNCIVVLLFLIGLI